MRCTWFPLLLLFTAYGMSAQSLPDFDKAVDPEALDQHEIYEHLDTTNYADPTVELPVLKEEFAIGEPISIHTYYQRSSEHLLLRMGQMHLTNPRQQLYARAEGEGVTIYRISDGQCTLYTLISKTSQKIVQSTTEKKCIS